METRNLEQCERFLAYITDNRNKYYRLAYSYMGNEADSMDALSQLTVIIIEKSADIRNEDSFPAWSKRVLVNICKSRLKEKKRREIAVEFPLELACADPHSADETDCLAVRSAVKALSPHYRDTLILRYYLGYEYAEISAILAIPEGTVKSRLHRAINELKVILRENGLDDGKSEKGA